MAGVRRSLKREEVREVMAQSSSMKEAAKMLRCSTPVLRRACQKYGMSPKAYFKGGGRSMLHRERRGYERIAADLLYGAEREHQWEFYESPLGEACLTILGVGDAVVDERIRTLKAIRELEKAGKDEEAYIRGRGEEDHVCAK